MSITPQAVQDLLDELEASKQSRLHAWNVLQKLRAILAEFSKTATQHQSRRRLILVRALTGCLRRRNEALKDLCAAVRRFRDASVKEECRSDYPHAMQAGETLGSGGGSDSGLRPFAAVGTSMHPAAYVFSHLILEGLL